MKKYEVFNRDNDQWEDFSEERLNGVDLKTFDEAFLSVDGNTLEVQTIYGDTVYYKNIHGTWGSKTRIR